MIADAGTTFVALRKGASAKWIEDECNCCKTITVDTPVEYHSVDDLQMGPATSSLIPKFVRRGRDINAALQLIASVTAGSGLKLAGAGLLKDKYEHEWSSAHKLHRVSEKGPSEIIYAVHGTVSHG